ncbi:hypothetical protein [Chromobacterium sphagni]|uniref:hypothetical protein n=1 Tax=Chromobacterium sphagni TaxID=1903179 RepID=UPI0019D3CA0B|nr:hypothetical protein [Chromobacterium sphagni]
MGKARGLTLQLIGTLFCEAARLPPGARKLPTTLVASIFHCVRVPAPASTTGVGFTTEQLPNTEALLS